jgi:hypothetical protein
MIKHLLNFLLIFLMLSSISFASKEMDAKLKAEFGQDLTHAPYFIRFAFYERYHRDWKTTYYTDRKYFLTAYETNVAADQAKEKARAKAEAAKEKERVDEAKEVLRRQKDRLKAQLEKEKAEKRDDRERQKEFDDSVRGQQREIRQMQREVIQQRGAS